MKLLSKAESNMKLAKSIGHGFLVAGLSLRPSDLSGHNVCPWSTAGCRAACVLEYSGRGNMPNVKSGRTDKTERFFADRAAFLADLHSDLYALERRAKKLNLVPCVRLNVASDLAWESIDPTLFSLHPSIRFYDYTKGAVRFRRKLPENYTLVYSFNEDSRVEDVSDILRAGGNVAIVFDTIYKAQQKVFGALPAQWEVSGIGFVPVVDGDEHDLRLSEIDGAGVIVGLRGKGGADIVLEGVASGFIVPTADGVSAMAKRKPLRVIR